MLEKQQYSRFTVPTSNVEQPRTDLRDENGHPIDPDFWGLEVTKHFRTIMEADNPDLDLTEDQQQMIYGYHPEAPTITADVVREAIMQMKSDKVSGDCELSTNLVIEAADVVAPHLAKEFTKIIRNEGGCDCQDGHADWDDTFAGADMIQDHSWLFIKCVLLEKKSRATHPKDLRPISLLPTLFKILDRCLPILCRDFEKALPENDIGGRKGYQCADIQQALKQALDYVEDTANDKAHNYHGTLVIAKVEIKKAFDSVSHSVLWQCLLNAGMPRWLAAALLRQHRRGTNQYVTRHFESFRIKRQEGLHQGAPTSMLLWRIVLNEAFRRVYDLWSTQPATGLEIDAMEGRRKLYDLRWADDIFILARDPGTLQFMLNTLKEALSTLNLELAPQDKDKMSWAGNPRTKFRDIICGGYTIHETPEMEGLPVPGR